MAAVYAAAQDVEGLAPFISDVESITVQEREALPAGPRTVTAWVGLLPEFRRKLYWTEQDFWDDTAHHCQFQQVTGDFDRYEGDWTFVSTAEGVVVELVVRYEYDVPLIGPLIQKLLQRKVQQSVDRIQEGLARRATGAA